MPVSRGYREAQLPQAQPFFELPFNEMLGAMTARQSRYDQVLEQSAAAKAALAKIQAASDPDRAYLADKNKKLDSLVNQYVDQDLSKQPGVDLMKGVRDLALDPHLTTIAATYKGFEDQMAAVAKLQQEGKYDPNLVDNSWKTYDSVAKGIPYRGYAESWDPKDLIEYVNDIPGTESFIDGNGAQFWRITDKDVRNRSIEVGKNFIDEADGRKWVVIDRKRTDQDANSLLYPDRTYEELSDEEVAQDIIYRAGRERIGSKVDKGNKPTKDSGGGYKIQDAYNILGVGSEGVGIEPITGLGFSQSTAEPIVGSFEATAKYKETDAGIKQGLQNVGAYNLSGNGVTNPEIIPNTTLDKFEFYWLEEQTGRKSLTWTTKNSADEGPTKDEVKLVERMLAKNKSAINDIAHSIEIDRQTALRGREVIREVNQTAGVDPNYKPTKEQNAQFNSSVALEYRSILIDPDGKWWTPGNWKGRANTAADFIYKNVPQDKAPFNRNDLVNYVAGDVHGISDEDAAKYNLPGLYRRYLERALESDITSDKSLRNQGEIDAKLAMSNARLVLAEESAFDDVDDPQYKRVGQAWRQYTKEQAYITTPYYDFGASTEGNNARTSLERLIDPGIRNKTISIYDTQSNEYVPFTEESWGFWTKDRWSNGKFSVVGWRPDRSKTSNGTIVLVEYRDKEGVADGKMYEIRKNVGLANFLSHDPELADDVHFMTESAKINNGLAQNNNWKTQYQMDDSLPPVTVYALQNDVAGADGKIQFHKGGYKMITPDGRPIYAEHEKDLLDKYRQEMTPYFNSLVSLTEVETMAQSANVVPNYSGNPAKGQVLPYDQLKKYTTSTTSDIPDTFKLLSDNSNLLMDVISQESSGDYTAVNKKSGASGLTGVLPSTAASPGYGVSPLTNVFDPQENVRFAKEYLLAMSNRYQGDVVLTLAAYSGGQVVADALKRNGKNINVLKSMGEAGEQAYNYLKDFQSLRGYNLNLKF